MSLQHQHTKNPHRTFRRSATRTMKAQRRQEFVDIGRASVQMTRKPHTISTRCIAFPMLPIWPHALMNENHRAYMYLSRLLGTILRAYSPETAACAPPLTLGRWCETAVEVERVQSQCRPHLNIQVQKAAQIIVPHEFDSASPKACSCRSMTTW